MSQNELGDLNSSGPAYSGSGEFGDDNGEASTAIDSVVASRATILHARVSQ